MTVSPRKWINIKRHSEKLHPRHIFWSNYVDVRTLSWCWCNDFPSLCEPELVTPNKLGLKLSTHSTRGRGNFETRRSSLCLLREEVISTRKNPNIPNSTIPGFIDNWKSNSNYISMNINFNSLLVLYYSLFLSLNSTLLSLIGICYFLDLWFDSSTSIF